MNHLFLTETLVPLIAFVFTPLFIALRLQRIIKNPSLQRKKLQKYKGTPNYKVMEAAYSVEHRNFWLLSGLYFTQRYLTSLYVYLNPSMEVAAKSVGFVLSTILVVVGIANMSRLSKKIRLAAGPSSKYSQQDDWKNPL